MRSKCAPYLFEGDEAQKGFTMRGRPSVSKTLLISGLAALLVCFLAGAFFSTSYYTSLVGSQNVEVLGGLNRLLVGVFYTVGTSWWFIAVMNTAGLLVAHWVFEAVVTRWMAVFLYWSVFAALFCWDHLSNRLWMEDNAMAVSQAVLTSIPWAIIATFTFILHMKRSRYNLKS